MDVHHYEFVYVCSEHSYYWMTSYTHHTYVDAPNYVNTDDYLTQTEDQTLHDTPHSSMDAPHYVSVEVQSEYTGKEIYKYNINFKTQK